MIRFEIVISDAEQPWHARIRAGNSEVTFTGEQLGEHRSALDTVVHHIIDLVEPDDHELVPDGLILIVNGQNRLIEIVDVDERARPPEVPC